MNTDTERLRQYVEEGSESAFTDLVREHLGLVYSAALRETNGNTALAEDIAQGVFTELARKAPRLLWHPSPAGWLYTTVRHLAANSRRTEAHRRQREAEAHDMKDLASDGSPNDIWQRIRPVLDDALHELKESDRSAVVLRFLEGRTLREVGDCLGLNENAARMRVDRALDKLRSRLARRGITSTASGLVAALAIAAVSPPPATLAATIANTALAGIAAAGSTTLTLTRIMSMTVTKTGGLGGVKLALAGVVVVAAVGLPAWQQTRLARAQSEIAQLRAQTPAGEAGSPAPEMAALRAEVERLRKVEVDQKELEQLRQWQAKTKPELLRLRGMAAAARQANADLGALQAQMSRQAAQGANPAPGASGELMRSLMEQQADSHLARITASLHLSPEQAQAAREILLREARASAETMQMAMSGHIDKDQFAKLRKDAGNPDAEIKALLTPEQSAAWPDYKQQEAAHNAGLAANSDLVQIQSTLGLTPEQLDRAYAALYDVSYNQMTGKAVPQGTSQADIMQWTYDQKANALESILTPEQLQNYRQQQALQVKLGQDVLSKIQGVGVAK